MKAKFVMLALVLFFWMGYHNAQAELITIEITGNVTSIGGYSAPSSIQVGDIFTGTYIYDSSTIDSGGGVYKHDSPFGIELSLGGYEFKTVPSHTGQFEISILNDYVSLSGDTYDKYRVRSYANSPLSNGVQISDIRWSLSDITHSAVSSTALPTIAPILDDWNGNYLEIYGFGNSLSIQGTVTQAVLIPEPTSLLFLATGSMYLIHQNRVMKKR